MLTEVSLGCGPRAGAVAAFGSVTLAEAFGSVWAAAFGSVWAPAFGSASAGALASRRAKICAHCRSTEPESSRYFR